MIPPKLVKIAAQVSCSPLSKATSNNVVPGDAKFALVSALDKGPCKKNEISNFRPVSVSTIFLKILKRFQKGR